MRTSLLILGSVKPPQFRAWILSDLAARSQGSLLLLNVGFQEVDWGSTTRRSEVRWRPENAFPVASDQVRRLQSHGEPKGQEGSSLAPRLARYQAQSFAFR